MGFESRAISAWVTKQIVIFLVKHVINRFITLRSHSDESSFLHRLANPRHDKSVHILKE